MRFLIELWKRLRRPQADTAPSPAEARLERRTRRDRVENRLEQQLRLTWRRGDSLVVTQRPRSVPSRSGREKKEMDTPR